ncbi:MAG: nucleotidyltransferase family protein [Deltaproteobacteria bacterium]|nr:nucleotidyltransferase family protein [Deltaproteobacteria bacterium]
MTKCEQKVAGIILAAGLSTRFGRPKQLLVADGRMLPAHVLLEAKNAGLDPLILVLGHQADAVKAQLSSPIGLQPEIIAQLTIVENSDYKSGQASSLQAGLRAVPPDVGAAIFLMGDEAGLRAEVVAKIVRAYFGPDRPLVVRPCYGGCPGGPILWSRPLFSALMTLTGDVGGRSLLKQLPLETIFQVELPTADQPWDVDTESDFEKWLNKRG